MEIAATSSSSSLSATAIPQQSQWLQTTLSELDMKMKAMMTLLQESDESKPSCQNADVSNDWKQELVKMLAELNGSYCSLAHKYDQLRSKSLNFPRSGSSSLSSNSTEIQQAIDQRRALQASNDPTWEASDTCHESVDDSDYEHYRSDFEHLNKLADDLVLTEQCNMAFMRKPEEKINREFSDEEEVAEFQKGSFEKVNSWFQVTKLMEETMRQQAELLRRNEEKRETIIRLRQKLEHLKNENKILHLQKCLYCSNIGIKRNHSQTSRSTGLFLGRFFNGGCS
ncbi:Networked 3C [Hibiscus trionum]|uniref:Networked 3C n=1 Tax=Hibiscus trionum TaxID=183268 RepID=A0A9W7LKN6_HIBTR|nr:Networked 3C [Hibiscus trionum]